MIKNAVLHLHNEQPLLTDLFDMPTAQDASLICTNVREKNGKRPIFADHADSVFIFPVGHIRFLEVPATSLGREGFEDAGGSGDPALALSAPREEPEVELEIDEDFLRRVREA